MKPHRLAYAFVALLTLSLLLTACGTDSSGDLPTPVTGASGAGDPGTAAPAGSTPAATHPPVAQAGAKMGAAVPVKDYTISLDSATVAGGVLKGTFTVDNTKGSGQVNLPDAAFIAFQTPDGPALDHDIVCTTMAVKVDMGKKAQGLSCWKVPGATATTGMRVRYDAGRSGGAIVNWDLP